MKSYSNKFNVRVTQNNVTYTWPYAVLNSTSRQTPVGDFDLTAPGGIHDDTFPTFQRYHLMSDGETFLIRGTGNGHNYTYNSIRYFKPADAVTPSTPCWGRYQNFGAPTNRIRQYNNTWHTLIPASAMGDGLGDAHFWPNYGIWRSGPNEWTYGPNTSEDQYRRLGLAPSVTGMSQIVSIEHGVNPLVVTSVPHAVSTGLYPGGMIHAWFVAPGWSLHDKIYQVVMVSDTVPYSYRIMGADTTSDPVFTAGAIAGQLCPAWHLQNPDNFWPPTSPIWTDYVRDDTSPTTFDRFPNGQDVYNPLQDWWPAGEQALIVGGGAGSDSQITRAWKMERNPNYPATQTQPWRFVNWNLLNTGASAWVWRLHHNEGGKVVSNPGDVDYLYCAGGVTWNGSAYIVQRIFHRIRCSDGWVEKLPDLPANLPTSMYGMLSWDEKRHGLLYIGYRVYWFDLDAYRASPGTTTWLDITPYPIRNYTTNTGVYRPMSGSTGGYVRSLDAHFFRGTPKLDFAPVVSHGALINAPETTGTPERFTFARIQLPSTWIKE